MKPSSVVAVVEPSYNGVHEQQKRDENQFRPTLALTESYNGVLHQYHQHQPQLQNENQFDVFNVAAENMVSLHHNYETGGCAFPRAGNNSIVSSYDGDSGMRLSHGFGQYGYTTKVQQQQQYQSHHQTTAGASLDSMYNNSHSTTSVHHHQYPHQHFRLEAPRYPSKTWLVSPMPNSATAESTAQTEGRFHPRQYSQNTFNQYHPCGRFSSFITSASSASTFRHSTNPKTAGRGRGSLSSSLSSSGSNSSLERRKEVPTISGVAVDNYKPIKQQQQQQQQQQPSNSGLSDSAAGATGIPNIDLIPSYPISNGFLLGEHYNVRGSNAATTITTTTTDLVPPDQFVSGYNDLSTISSQHSCDNNFAQSNTVEFLDLNSEPIYENRISYGLYDFPNTLSIIQSNPVPPIPATIANTNTNIYTSNPFHNQLRYSNNLQHDSSSSSNNHHHHHRHVHYNYLPFMGQPSQSASSTASIVYHHHHHLPPPPPHHQLLPSIPWYSNNNNNNINSRLNYNLVTSNYSDPAAVEPTTSRMVFVEGYEGAGGAECTPLGWCAPPPNTLLSNLVCGFFHS